MSKDFLRVDEWVHEHKSVFVKLKKGLRILLFSVSTSTMVGITSPVSGYEYNLCAENTVTDVQLPQTGINLRLERNCQECVPLFNSLMKHRGDLMTRSEKDAFGTVAAQVSKIGFTDAMVCYDEDDKQVTFDLLTSAGVILHLTQYFEEPTDQVVYSVERNGKFLCAGHLPVNGFSSQLSEVVRNVESAS